MDEWEGRKPRFPKNVERFLESRFRVSYKDIPKIKSGTEICGLIFFSLGRNWTHESGYPLIWVLGVGRNGQIYDMGFYHDLILFETKEDKPKIDSVDKNIFLIKFHICKTVSSFIGSTIEITDHAIY